jgi:hypothetical protein
VPCSNVDGTLTLWWLFFVVFVSSSMINVRILR